MTDTVNPIELQPESEASDAIRAPVLLQMPMDNRSLSMAVLALLGVVFMLHWAGAVVIPVMLGLMLSYALRPAVSWLQGLGLARALAAGIVMVALVGTTCWTAWTLSDDATQFVESLPAAAQKVRQMARTQRNKPDSALDKVQKAATQLEQAAKESATSAPAAASGVTRVQIERPQFNLKDYLWSSMPAVAMALGQAVAVLFVAYFLLASGDSFRRKMVRLAGPTFARRKITVQALDEITGQIQRYLLIQVVISVVVGLATGLAFLFIGVEHAAVWGMLAFALNFIPYIGSLVLTAGSALVGFVQFNNVETALLIAGVSLLLHIVTGNLLAPWLMSRTSRLNTVTIFVGMLAFGWLWGVWGLLLGVPILLMVKSVCDRVDDFKPLGELLGT